jgi:WD40 repeat protein
MFQNLDSDCSVQLRCRCLLAAAVMLLGQATIWAGGRGCLCDTLLQKLDPVKIPQSLRLSKPFPELIAAHQIGTRSISALAFIDDGANLAVAEHGPDQRGGEAGRVVILDLKGSTPRIGATLKATSDTIGAFAVAPDGEFFVTGGIRWDRTLAVWSGDEPKHEPTWKSQQTTSWWFKTLQFSNDGKRLASATSDSSGPVQLWSVNAEPRTLDAHEILPGPAGGLSAVAFSPDGRFLAAGLGSGHGHSNDGRLLIWDVSRAPAALVSEGNIVSARAPQSYDVTAIVFSRDGKRLITADQQGMLRTWSLHANGHFEPLRVIAAHGSRGGGIQSLAITLNDCVISSGYDGIVNLWNVETGGNVRRWDFGQENSTVLAVAPSLRHVAVGLANGAVYILQLDTQ